MSFAEIDCVFKDMCLELEIPEERMTQALEKILPVFTQQQYQNYRFSTIGNESSCMMSSKPVKDTPKKIAKKKEEEVPIIDKKAAAEFWKNLSRSSQEYFSYGNQYPYSSYGTPSSYSNPSSSYTYANEDDSDDTSDEDNYNSDDSSDDSDNDYKDDYKDDYSTYTTTNNVTINGIPVPTQIDDNFHKFFQNFDRFFLPQNLHPEPKSKPTVQHFYGNDVKLNDPSLDYLLELAKPENLQRFISNVTESAKKNGTIFVTPSDIDHQYNHQNHQRSY